MGIAAQNWQMNLLRWQKCYGMIKRFVFGIFGWLDVAAVAKEILETGSYSEWWTNKRTAVLPGDLERVRQAISKYCHDMGNSIHTIKNIDYGFRKFIELTGISSAEDKKAHTRACYGGCRKTERLLYNFRKQTCCYKIHKESTDYPVHADLSFMI